MVYKRYIKRGGKTFGPYYYESYRDANGVPRTRQVPPPRNQVSKIQKQIIGLVSLLVIIIGVFLVFGLSANVEKESSFSLTGKTVSDAYSKYSTISKNSITSAVSKSAGKGLLEISDPSLGSFLTGFATQDLNETSADKENETEETSDNETSEAPAENDTSNETNETENQTENTTTPNETTSDTSNETTNTTEPTNETDTNVTTPDETNETENQTENTTTPNETTNATENDTSNETGTEETSDNETSEVPAENETQEPTNNTSNETTNTTEPTNDTEQMNESENQSVSDVITNISTEQYKAVIGKPVKWKKEILVTESGIESNVVSANKIGDSEQNQAIRVNLPSSSGNISVDKVENETNTSKRLDIKTSGNEKNIQEVEPVRYEEKEQGNIPRRVQNFLTMAGNVVNIRNVEEEVVVEINESMKEGDKFEVQYSTTAPYSQEKFISENKKNITVIGPDEVHYQEILAFSKLPREVSNKESVNLKHFTIKSGQRDVDFEIHDTDEDGLYEYVSWIVPHLSEQNYELSLDMLTVQSYPVTQGDWNVEFSTVGSGDLRITPVDGTYWEDESNDKDLRFISVKCGNTIQDYEFVGEELVIENYSCSETSTETSQVLTSGKHALRFDFGNATAYAYNDAQDSNVPRTLNLHGKLTNSSGEILTGTYNMTFRIYDSYTGGGLLYESNRTITTDDAGVYNVVLNDVNMSFENETYLGIKVENDSEMSPRINLTSTPYTERARVADSLNPDNNYQMKNLSISKKITFEGGEEILKTDGLIKITDSLNVSDNITAEHFIGNGSLLTDVATEGDGIYLYLNRTEMNLNESRLNETIDERVLQQKYYAGEEYIYLNGSRFFKLNETVLNRTIEDIASQYDDTDYIDSQLDNYYNITEINEEFSNYYNKSETQDRFVNESEAENLSVNYSEYSNETNFWNGVQDWVAKWFYEDNDSLAFNETQLNNTIDDRAQVSDTNETARFNNLTDGNCSGNNKMVGVDDQGNVVCEDDVTIGNCSEDQSCENLVYTSDDYIGGLSCNDSQIAKYNNDTGTWECSEDVYTLWNITGYMINDSGSLNVNETKLNNTINLLDNDTLAELNCGDKEIAKFNLSSSQWECANDSDEDTLYYAEGDYILKNDSNYFSLNETRLNETIDDRVLKQKYYAGEEYIYLNGSRFFKLNETVLNRTIEDIASQYNDTDYIDSQLENYYNKSETQDRFVNESEAENLSVNYSEYSNETNFWNGVQDWVAKWFYEDNDSLAFNETVLNDTIDSRAGDVDTIWNITGYMINDSGSLNVNETKLNNTINALENDTLYYAKGDYIFKNGSNYFYLNETILNNTIKSIDNDTLAGLSCDNNQIVKYNTTSGDWECSEDINTEKSAGGNYLWNDTDAIYFNETLLNDTINDLENDTLAEMSCNDSQIAKYDEASGEWVCSEDLDNDTLYYSEGDYILKNDSNYFSLNRTKLNNTINALENDTLAEMGCNDSEVAIYNGTSGQWECTLGTDLEVNSTDYWDDLDTPSDINHSNLGNLQGGGGDEYYHLNQSFYQRVIDNAFNWLIGIWGENNKNDLLVSNGTHIGYNQTVLNDSINALDDDTLYYANEKYIFKNGSNYFYLNESVLNNTIKSIDNDTLAELNCNNTQIAKYNNSTGNWECSEDINTEKSAGGNYLWNDTEAIFLNETVLNDTINDLENDTLAELNCDDSQIAKYNLTSSQWECANDSDEDTLYYAEGDYILKNDSNYFSLNETRLNETINALDDDTTYTNGTGLELNNTVFSLLTTCADSEILKWNDTSEKWHCSEDIDTVWDITGYVINDSGSLNVNETMLNSTINALENDTLYYAKGDYIFKNGSNYFYLNETKLNNTVDSLGNDTLAELNCEDSQIARYNTTSGDWECSEDINTEKSAGGNYLWNDSESIFLNETVLNDTIDSRAEDIDTIWDITGYMINDSGSLNVNETMLNATIEDLDDDTLYYANEKYIFKNGSNFFYLNETILNDTINTLENDTLAELNCNNTQIAKYNNSTGNWECSEDINTEKSAGGNYLWNDSESIFLNETVLNDTINALDNDTLASLGCIDDEIIRYNTTSGNWECSGNIIDGIGTANYIPIWSDNKTLYDSVIYQDSQGNLGIGTETPETELGMGQGSISGVDSLEWDIQTVNGARTETWDGAGISLGNVQGDWGDWPYSGTISVTSSPSWTSAYEGSVLEISSESYVTSPSINLDDWAWSSGRIYLGFWMDFYGDSGDKHKIMFSNDGGSTWTTLETINQPSGSLDQKTGWQYLTYDVTALAEHGGDHRVRFESPSGSFSMNQVVVDNVRMIHAPSLGRWTGSDNPNDISYTGGFVGIGTDNPQATLSVGGDSYVSGNMNISGNTSVSEDVGVGGEVDAAGIISSQTDICIEGGNCLSEAGTGSGDITAVYTNLTAYLLGGSTSGDVNLDFNETKLNNTINSLDNDTLYYAKGDYIWKNNSNYFILNESRLNETIKSIDNDTLSGLNCNDNQIIRYNTTSGEWECSEDIDTVWDITGYMINDSGSLNVNETMLNATIEDLDDDTLYYGKEKYIWKNGSNFFYLNESVLNDTVDDRVLQQRYYAGEEYIYLNGSRYFKLNETRLNLTINDIAEAVNTEKSAGGNYLWNDSESIYVNETVLNDTIDSRAGDVDTIWNITGYMINDSGSLNVNETMLNATIEDLDDDTLYYANEKYIFKNGSNFFYLNETILNNTIKSIDNDTLAGLSCDNNQIVKYNTTSGDWECSEDINTEKSAGGNYLWNDTDAIYFNETLLNDTINDLENDTLAELNCDDSQIAKYNLTSSQWECANDSDEDTLYYAEGDYILKNDSNYFSLNETRLNETINALDDDTTYTNGTGLELNNTVFSLLTTCADSEILKWNDTSEKWYCSEDVNTEKYGGGNYLWNDTEAIYLNDTELNKTINELDNDTLYYAKGIYILKNDSNYFSLNESRLNNTIDDRALTQEYYAGEEYIYLNGSRFFKLNETVLNRTIEDIASQYNDTDYIDSQLENYYNKSETQDRFVNESEAENLSVNYSEYSNETNFWNGVQDWVAKWFYEDNDSLAFNETVLNDTIDSRAGDVDTIWNITGYMINDSGSLNVNETMLNATIEDLDDDTLYYANEKYIFKNGSNFFYLNETILNNTIKSIDNDTLAGLSCDNNQIVKYNTTSGDWECSEDINTEKSAGGNYLWNDTDAIYFNETLLNDTINDLENDTLAELNCDDKEIAKFNITSSQWECANDSDEDTLYYAEGDYILKNDSNYFSLNETKLNETINALENDTLAEMNCNDSQIAKYNSSSEEWECAEEADLQVNSSDYWDDLDTPSDINHSNLGNLQGGGGDEYYHLNQSFYQRVIDNAFNWLIGIWGDNNQNDLLVSNGTHVGYNQTVLNDSINALDDDTLYYANEKYIFKNGSNYFYLNETILNNTIKSIDNDTLSTLSCSDEQIVRYNTTSGDWECSEDIDTNWNITEYIINDSGSLNINETILNRTINDLENDTLAELNCDDKEIAKFNITSSQWECANDSDEDTLYYAEEKYIWKNNSDYFYLNESRLNETIETISTLQDTNCSETGNCSNLVYLNYTNEGDINVSSSYDICIEGGNCLSNVAEGTVSGNGTENYLPKWSSDNESLEDSSIQDETEEVTVWI